MSGATTEGATEALRSVMADSVRPLAGAVMTVREAQTALSLAVEVTDMILAAGSLILAAEALEDAAKAVSARCRESLRDQMADMGCWSQGNETLLVSLADAPRTVTISDVGAIALSRPDLMKKPEPSPDRKAIAAELNKGVAVDGAHLSGDNGMPVLRITTRRK